jgi:hypothetical protein
MVSRGVGTLADASSMKSNDLVTGLYHDLGTVGVLSRCSLGGSFHHEILRLTSLRIGSPRCM